MHSPPAAAISPSQALSAAVVFPIAAFLSPRETLAAAACPAMLSQISRTQSSSASSDYLAAACASAEKRGCQPPRLLCLQSKAAKPPNPCSAAGVLLCLWGALQGRKVGGRPCQSSSEWERLFEPISMLPVAGNDGTLGELSQTYLVARLW